MTNTIANATLASVSETNGTISAALREAIVAEAIKSIKEGDKHENA